MVDQGGETGGIKKKKKIYNMVIKRKKCANSKISFMYINHVL